MKKYDSYKDSGVKWLGEIPEHWKIRKLKWIFTEKKKVTNPTLNCGSISFGRVVYKDDEKIPEATKKSYQVLNKGEFLLNPLNLNYDLKSLRIALSEIDVVVSSGYIVLQNQIQIHKDYYKWLLHIYDILYMKTLGAGVRQTINFYDISESLLCLPGDEEQKAIAEFLDDKTAKIDQLIAIKEKEIDLLKERRQILIQELVTGQKIWDGNKWTKPTKTKDSGVDWIGEIPEDWEVRKLRNCLRAVSIKNRPDLQLLSITRERGVIVRNTEDLEENHNFIPDDLSGYKVVRKGQFGMNKMKAWQGSYGISDYDGIVSPAYFIFDVTDKFIPEYFHLAIRSKVYIPFFTKASDGVRIGQWDLNKARMNEIPFFIPNENQQIKIVSHVNEVNEKIEYLISLKQQEIEKLKEYKTILIDNAVTGKMKVC